MKIQLRQKRGEGPFEVISLFVSIVFFMTVVLIFFFIFQIGGNNFQATITSSTNPTITPELSGYLLETVPFDYDHDGDLDKITVYHLIQLYDYYLDTSPSDAEKAKDMIEGSFNRFENKFSRPSEAYAWGLDIERQSDKNEKIASIHQISFSIFPDQYHTTQYISSLYTTRTIMVTAMLGCKNALCT